jgi:anti-anti-sigma factor
MAGGQVPSAYDRHALLVYHDEAVRSAQLASFATRGLERGEVVLCTAAAEDGAFEEYLAAWGTDVARTVGTGQLRRVSLGELFSAGGLTGYVTGVLQGGYPGVRVCGNAASSAAHLGLEAMWAAEQEMDRLCDTLPVAALCHFDAEAAQSQQRVRELVAAHPQAVRTDTMLLTRCGVRVQLDGEVDLSSAPVLEAALQQCADGTGGRSVLVDLTKLIFIDIAGYDALLRGTDQFRAHGGTLVLRGDGPGLQVLDLLGMRERDDVLFI